MSQARTLFDAVINEHPSTKEHLQADATIFLHPNFETAIAKIQDGRANELTVQTKRAVEFLKQNASAENSEGRLLDSCRSQIER